MVSHVRVWSRCIGSSLHVSSRPSGSPARGHDDSATSHSRHAHFTSDWCDLWSQCQLSVPRRQCHCSHSCLDIDEGWGVNGIMGGSTVQRLAPAPWARPQRKALGA